MKNLFRISALALLAFSTISCSREDDSVQSNTELKNVDNNGISTEKISFTKTKVVAISQEVAGLGVNNSISVNYGTATVSLVMQSDGNLVMYKTGLVSGAIWQSYTSGYNPWNNYPFVLKAQTDGNLVIYKNAPYVFANAIWQTATNDGVYNNPTIQLQILEIDNQVTGSRKHRVEFVLKQNGSNRLSICSIDIDPIW